MLYSERRKQLQFSYQVKAEGWLCHCLSTPKAGEETQRRLLDLAGIRAGHTACRKNYIFNIECN